MLGWIVCFALVSAGPGDAPAGPDATARRAWPIELRAITTEAELAAATTKYGGDHAIVQALKRRLEALNDAKREAPTEDNSDQAMLAGELHLLDAKLSAESKALEAKGLGKSHPDIVALAKQRAVIASYLSTLPALELRAESGPPAVVRAVVEEAIAQGRLAYLSGLYGAAHPDVVAAQQRVNDASRVIARSRVSPHDREDIRSALMSAIHERLDVLHNPKTGRDDSLVEAELDGLAIAHARLAVRRFAGE